MHVKKQFLTAKEIATRWNVSLFPPKRGNARNSRGPDTEQKIKKNQLKEK